MNTVENQNLVEGIFGNVDHPIVDKFSLWINNNARFKSFVRKYRKKIKGKDKLGGALKNTQNLNKKLEDIQFELEVAYLLLGNDYFSHIEYEKEKSLGSAPDFTVTCLDKTIFNIEVKHIRKSELEERFTSWEKKLATEVYKIPSETLVVEPIIKNVAGLDEYANLIDRLENNHDEILDFIREITAEAEETLIFQTKKIYPVPNFDEKLYFELSKPKRRESKQVLWRRLIEREVFYTQQEYKKFGDLICNPKVLAQLKEGMINILIFITRSETHEDLDLTLQTLPNLQKLIAQNNDQFFIKKGFPRGVNEFLRQYNNWTLDKK